MDSSVIVASFLDSEAGHADAQEYIDGLENGEYTFHLPMLVVVEVASAIGRRVLEHRTALLAVWKRNVVDWERDGKLFLYTLDRERMLRAVASAERHRLRGPDSVVAALAEELDIPLKTFDTQVLDRFPLASL